MHVDDDDDKDEVVSDLKKIDESFFSFPLTKENDEQKFLYKLRQMTRMNERLGKYVVKQIGIGFFFALSKAKGGKAKVSKF